MPPTSRPRGNIRRLLWIVFALAILTALGGWAFVSLGRLLYEEDPLERADAIFVLGGRWLDRVAEAGDLYVEGRAPVIVLSRELPDYGEEALRARGFNVPAVSDAQVQALVTMGVPPSAIQVLEPQVATATEAETITALAVSRDWRTVIAITNKLHTARAGLVMRRHTRETNVRILLRATRYDPANVDYWWQSRQDFRFALFEAQKMLAYWVGLAD